VLLSSCSSRSFFSAAATLAASFFYSASLAGGARVNSITDTNIHIALEELGANAISTVTWLPHKLPHFEPSTLELVHQKMILRHALDS